VEAPYTRIGLVVLVCCGGKLLVYMYFRNFTKTFRDVTVMRCLLMHARNE